MLLFRNFTKLNNTSKHYLKLTFILKAFAKALLYCGYKYENPFLYLQELNYSVSSDNLSPMCNGSFSLW